MMVSRILRLVMALSLGSGVRLRAAGWRLGDTGQTLAVPARRDPGDDQGRGPSTSGSNNSYGGTYGDTASLVMRNRTAQSVARKNGLRCVDGWPMPLLGVDCYVMHVARWRIDRSCDRPGISGSSRRLVRADAIVSGEGLTLDRSALPDRAGGAGNGAFPTFTRSQPAAASALQ